MLCFIVCGLCLIVYLFTKRIVRKVTMVETQEYEELLKNYTKLQIDLESANQALHDCRRQMKTAQTIEAEYQEEIRILQSQGTVEQQKLETKIQLLEENSQTVKTTYNERINYLEKELSTKEDEVKDLKKELDDIIKITDVQEPSFDDKLIDEISELKLQNVDLGEHVAELQKSLEASGKQNLAFQERMKQMEEELENYKETFKCKREELDEANALIQNLKDDFLCVKSELDSVRSQPLDDKSRGNSLFAEVDDRRLQLQQNMNTMKTKYLEMKRERGSLLKQIATLRNENATLIAQLEGEVEGQKRDDQLTLDTYKSQIQTLNDLIESYKKELSEKEKFTSTSSPPQGMKFFDNMLAMKNKEIEDLRQKLSFRSLNQTTLSYDLAQANKLNRKHNVEILQLKNEIGMLKIKIQEMEMLSPTEKAAPEEVKPPKSIVKNTKTDQNEVDLNADKENDNVNKKVQFTETTLEPQVTDRSKFRKGAKVLISKPIKYS